MKENELNLRRNFLKDGGVALLAATGLVAAASGKAHATEDPEQPECECIQGAVLLRKPSGEAKIYQAAADTGAGRWSALNAALQDAKLSSDAVVIELLQGDFALPTESLMYFYQISVLGGSVYTGKLKIVFRENTSLKYTDPTEAGWDYPFFDGPRNVRNFGAKGNGVDDDWSSIMAALYSLKENPGSIDEFGNTTRYGEVYFPIGTYPISKEIIIQSVNRLYGQKGALIKALDNLKPVESPDPGFPDEDEKWMLRTARHVNGANTNHHISISNLAFQAGGTGNEKLNGILFYGAQISDINVDISNAYRGLVIGWGSSHTTLKSAQIDNCRFSGLEIHGSNVITVEDLSVYGMDPTGSTTNFPVLVSNCSEVVFSICFTEQGHNGIKIVGSNGVTIGALEATSVTSGGTGILIDGCYAVKCCHFRGGNKEKLLVHKINGSVVREIPGNLSGWGWGTYQTEEIINTLEATILENKFLETDQITWSRDDSSVVGAKRWRLNVGEASNNPTWALSSNDAAGAQYREHIRVAIANGGAITGYTVLLDTYGIGGVYIGSKLWSKKGYVVVQGSADPTNTDIPDGCRQTWRNGAGQIRDWVNIGGTMYKSAPYTT